MKMIRILAVLAAFSALFGCAATAPKPSFNSVIKVPAEDVIEKIHILPIEDNRDTRGLGDSYFGTIRGGYGNPLERMHFNGPASDFVEENVAISLSRSNYEVTDRRRNDALILKGSISRLWARNNAWGGTREVEFAILIQLYDGNKNLIWSKDITAIDTDNKFAGMEGNTPIMEGWLAKLVQDKVFDTFNSIEPDSLSSLE